MEECIVCFEETDIKTECNHSLCKDCKEKLKTMKCPYCQQELENSYEIIIAFYHFISLFDSFYQENPIYQNLKKGIDFKSIITTELLFYIEEKDNFDDRGIRVKIHKHSYINNYSKGRIIFSVPGLNDKKKDFHYFTFSKKGIMLENYFNE